MTTQVLRWLTDSLASSGIAKLSAGFEETGAKWIVVDIPAISLVLSSNPDGSSWAVFDASTTDALGSGATLSDALQATAAMLATSLL